MAKKKTVPVPVPLCELVERAVRDALARLPELQRVSELDYCNAVLEGLDLISDVTRMRLQELENDADEEE